MENFAVREKDQAVVVAGDVMADRANRPVEHLVWILSAAAFLVFFQANMIAPLIPRLSITFGVSDQTIGLIVPVYMIPYGIAALFYNLLSDRVGRRRIMLASLLAFVILTTLTATAQSAAQMTWPGGSR